MTDDQALLQEFVADHARLARRFLDRDRCDCGLCTAVRASPWWTRHDPLMDVVSDLASGRDGVQPTDEIYQRAAHADGLIHLEDEADRPGGHSLGRHGQHGRRRA